MPDGVIRYPRYRFPPAIISHAVWLYYRFTLSFRDVEDLPGTTRHHRLVPNRAALVPNLRPRLRAAAPSSPIASAATGPHIAASCRPSCTTPHATPTTEPKSRTSPRGNASSDAALQVRGPGTAIPLRPRCDSQPVQRRPAFTSRRPPSGSCAQGRSPLGALVVGV